jgi:predicted MFS family arabinose efflux permease
MNNKSFVFVGLCMIAVTGIISSLSFLAYCLAIISSMLLIPRIGARRVIIMAGGFAFLGMIIISISPNSVVLAVGVFIAGISTGLSSPPYASVVKYWIDKPVQDQANVQMEALPDFFSTGFWIVIGVSGVFGGFAGSFIQKIGLVNSFRLSVICLASSSLLLAVFTSYVAPIFLSAFLFGSSYIFMTGVLLVWGIKIFNENSALGIGLPFFVLALGQLIGSAVAGILSEYYGYTVMFIFFSLIGFSSIAFKPRF